MRRSLVTREAVRVLFRRGWRSGHELALRMCGPEGDRNDLVVHLEIDRADGCGVPRLPQRQVAPLKILDRPDRGILLIPVGIVLVVEGYPSRQDPPLACILAGFVDARDHEAEAVLDRLVDVPGEIGDLAIAPGAGALDQTHRSLPELKIKI